MLTIRNPRCAGIISRFMSTFVGQCLAHGLFPHHIATFAIQCKQHKIIDMRGQRLSGILGNFYGFVGLNRCLNKNFIAPYNRRGVTRPRNFYFPADIGIFAPFHGGIALIHKPICIWPSQVGPIVCLLRRMVFCLNQNWNQTDTHQNQKPFLHGKLPSVR